MNREQREAGRQGSILELIGKDLARAVTERLREKESEDTFSYAGHFPTADAVTTALVTKDEAEIQSIFVRTTEIQRERYKTEQQAVAEFGKGALRTARLRGLLKGITFIG